MDSSAVLAVVIAAVATVGTVTALVVRSRWADWQTAKRMRALPRTNIRDVREGQRVRIVGAARALGALTAGVFSGEPCLATSATSIAAGRNAQDLPQPDDRSVVFRVEDTTGGIDVDAIGATLSIANSHSVDMESSRAFGAGIIAREGSTGSRRMSYYERRIVPGDQVAVIATVARDASGALRLSAPVELSTHDDALRS